MWLFPFIFVFYEITHYLANDMYLPAMPRLVADLQTTTHLGQQTITVWFLGTAALQLLLGPLSDRLGRKPILFLGGLIFILSTLICALTSNIHLFLIARFFQGTAVCAVITAGYSSIHELYDQIRAGFRATGRRNSPTMAKLALDIWYINYMGLGRIIGVMVYYARK
jgi:MFS transporter, DHA1 family, multidrug resistance protein